MTLESDMKKLKNKDLINAQISPDILNVDDIAEQLIESANFHFDREKKWWFFNKDIKQWVNVDKNDVFVFIKKTFNTFGLSDSNFRQKMLNALEDEARYKEPEKLEDWKIQIGKHIYDIRDDSQVDVTPKILPKIIIPHEINSVDEDDDCPFIDKLFEDWVGEDKNVLYDIIAYCMSPKHFLDICFWLVGKGENGKGLFQTIIHKVVGENNIISQDLELLSDPKDRFTKGFLRDKLVCSLGDGNYGILKHTKSIKTLSGCTDPIRAEIKGAGQTSFYNRAKLIGAYNTLPETSDKTDGFYRRQHITEFKNDFAGMKNPLPNVPEREYTILAKKCFDRLKEIYRSNIISGWSNKEERKEKYERLSNPIALFIKNKMIQEEDGFVFGKTLHKYYIQYALNKGYNSFTLKEFESRILNQGFVKNKKDVYTNNGFCWGKKSDIPKEIFDSKYESEWETTKLTVIYGLKYKFLEHLEQIEPSLELDSPYVDISNLK